MSSQKIAWRTPWLEAFNSRCDELLADIRRSCGQVALAKADVEARRSEFSGIADAFRVMSVAEQYDLTIADARTFIRDQQELDLAERNDGCFLK